MLNAAELLLLSEELDQTIGGGMIRKLRRLGADRFLIEVWKGQNHHLLIALEAPYFRSHLIDQGLPFPTPTSADQPDSLLKRELEGAHIVRIESLPGERILHWTLGRGGEPPWVRHLWIELFGSSRNLILTQDSGQIAFALREGGASRPTIKFQGHYAPPRPRPDGTKTNQAPFAYLDSLQPSISQALDRHIRPRETEVRESADREQWVALLARKLKKTEQRISGLDLEIAEAAHAASLRRQAELVQINLSTLPKGVETLELEDPMAPELPPVLLTLKPRETAAAAMARLFREAEKVEGRVARAASEKGRFEDILVALREGLAAAANEETPLEVLRADAVKLGILREDEGPKESSPPGTRKKKEPPPAREPFRRYRSKEDIEILVGRSSEDNDELTFKIARGNDVWLHVADYPGSHVVIRHDGEVPRETLLDAASLALHWSKAGPGARAPVSWTQRKHVKKFRGAKPGQVQLADRKTIIPKDGAERLKRLLGKS